VTVFVVLPMKEALAGGVPGDGTEAAPGSAGAGLRAAGVQMRRFAEDAFRSFLGARGPLMGVWVSLLPAGAMALGLALQSNLAVELGMSDDAVALMALVSTVVGGLCMVLGGWLADRLGRLLTLGVYTALISVPVLYLAWVLHAAGYVMPRAPGGPPLPDLIWHLWVATIAYAVTNGLMYGTRTAVYMDLTNPAVAGTQFTAYMAMQNLAIAFAAGWQGIAAERFGYPLTLLIDALTGLVGIALLPWLVRSVALCDEAAERRARTVGRVLAAACLVFVPWWWLHDRAESANDILQTIFTFFFVASALYLAAGGLLQRESAAFTRAARVLALALLLMYARRWVPAMHDALHDPARLVVAVVALAGAWGLWRMAERGWPGLAATGP
jgi:MFS transporter, PAT family, beta-lactamase induction signal transducer AmpG